MLYRNTELRRHQFFAQADWTGGIYATPSIAGSRAGGEGWPVLVIQFDLLGVFYTKPVSPSLGGSVLKKLKYEMTKYSVR